MVPTTTNTSIRDFANAVALGLSDTPRWLPARFLYDAKGSELFEQICKLPEYYLTRTEAAILSRSATTIREITGPVTMIELGSGSAVKTDHLLAAYAEAGRPVRYVPVDVSASILRVAADRIEETFPSVNVAGVHGEYEQAFPLLAEFAPTMLLFLGSTIGNMDHSESVAFWRRVCAAMPSGSFVLLGVDLMKDVDLLKAAYNDAGGVTARFTKNLFVRMNRELGAALDIDRIEHVARWNSEWRRIEIGARFETAQDLHVAPLDRTFRIEPGDRIMTEISRKFTIDELEAYLACFGLELIRTLTDDRRWFALMLFRKGDGECW